MGKTYDSNSGAMVGSSRPTDLTVFGVQSPTPPPRRHATTTSATTTTTTSTTTARTPAFIRPEGHWCPEETASPLSRLLFSWIDSLIDLGKSKTLESPDLWDLAREDEAHGVFDTFGQFYAASITPLTPKGSVKTALWKAYGGRFVFAGLLKLIHDLLMLLGPVLLQKLLMTLQQSGTKGQAFGLATLMFVFSIFQTLVINQYFHILYRISLHVKVCLVHMLYQKSLRITSAVRSSMGIGPIVNLQSNDASKIWNLIPYLHVVWSAPLQILIVMALLIRVLHFFPALAGFLITVGLIPVNTIVGKKLGKYRREMLKYTDGRVKLVTEVMTGIKAIKLYAWEVPYMNKIKKMREEELVMIKRTAFLSIINMVMFISGPVLVSLASFGTYVAMGYPLSASVAFPALALFNLLRFPIMMLPMQIMSIIQAQVGLKRLQGFMEQEEMKRLEKAEAEGVKGEVKVERGTFSWGAAAKKDKEEDSKKKKESSGGGAQAASPPAPDAPPPPPKPILHDINLSVKPGELIIVVGSVGSGKSSLLAALLGELLPPPPPTPTPLLSVHGSIAYTTQDPWIQNLSLKDNILMGRPLNPDLYEATISCCALEPDLAMLPAGDATEIGEKGVNLSGGQKHRVALARAVYSRSDIYLLDDPLSAVDSHVGKHLFHACIAGALSSKTRILVTHQLQFLPYADRIVVLREGRIAAEGTYDDLMAKGIDFHEIEKKDEAAGGDAKNGGVKKSGSQGSLAGGNASSSNSIKRIGKGVSMKRVTFAAPSQKSNEGMEKDKAERSARFTLQATPTLKSLDMLVGATPNPLASATITTAAANNNNNAKTNGTSRPKSLAMSASIRRTLPEEEKRLLEQPPSTLKSKEDELDKGRLVKKEERAVGQVKKSVYSAYLSAWGPMMLLPGAMVLAAGFERGLQVGQNAHLSVWSNAMAAREASGGKPIHSDGYYLAIYNLLGVTSILFQLFRSVVLVMGSNQASKRLHHRLLEHVVRLPMSFFDSQPTGRLLNRFTKDVDSIDTQVAQSVNSFITCLISVLGSVLVVVVVTPGVITMIIPIAFLYYHVQQAFIATSREIKRLDSLAFSPIFGHFNESLQGLVTVRAFGEQNSFAAKNYRLLDFSNRAYWPIMSVNRWLSIRIEMYGNLIVYGAAVFVSVLTRRSAGLAGLALTSALNVTGFMNWMVRQVTELEVNMNSVERMIEYEQYETEAPAVIPSSRPPVDWPTRGAIRVEGLWVRYRAELDPVLKNVSFSVSGFEKVGVCGRTGCGKSTLMMTLFRIVEPSAGRILIDGVDISSIGLRDLRSRLALVMQDCILFAGTIRTNLDPFDEIESDAALWEALERSGLDRTVRAMEGGLQAKITEGGGNLSTGQRQLLSMARALLRHARILVLDEATSNVDNATDALIQRTIRDAFHECTVLTIAHRLHTIIDSDKILVLDDGELVEFDSPDVLLDRPEGFFSKLVANAGGVVSIEEGTDGAYEGDE